MSACTRGPSWRAVMNDEKGRVAPKGGRCWPFLLVTGLYLVLAGWIDWLVWNTLNPDGVAYMQIARHYAHGRFDLAVTSYWGPLLSWILVPSVWLHLAPSDVFRVLEVLLGIGFAAGAASLLRALGGRRLLLTYAAALMLALTMLEPITPDLLLACCVTWYLSGAVRLIDGGSPRAAFRCGLLGGLAYLAKPYALPFCVAHLGLTFLLRWRARRAQRPQLTMLKPLLAAVAGLALLALPWIAVISAHDGALTVSSSGRLADDFLRHMPPNALLPGFLLTAPRPGRLTIWENPVEMGGWDGKTPPERLGWAQRLASSARVAITLNNMQQALRLLQGLDALGIVFPSFLLLPVLYAGFRPRLPARLRWLAVWCLFSVVMYLGGYCLIYIEQRYSWPIWPLLLATAVYALEIVVSRASNPLAAAEPTGPGVERERARLGRVVAAVLIFSVAASAALAARRLQHSSYPKLAANLREWGARLDLHHGVVSNNWSVGLYTSFWAGATFHGQFQGRSAEDVAAEIAPFGSPTVLLFRDESLSRILAESGQFRKINADRNLSAFEMVE